MKDERRELVLDPGEVQRAIAAAGRRCGSCSLCCKVLNVPEAGKPDHAWRPHCRPGRGGCAIYDARPEICRLFACSWLINPTLGEEWFPAKVKMVLQLTLEDAGHPVLYVAVDPAYPNRWA